MPHGFPARVDLAGPDHLGSALAAVRAAGYRWPAGRGPHQHPWEPPRTIAERGPDHARRLKALGNAVVPAVAEVVGRVLLGLMEEP